MRKGSNYTHSIVPLSSSGFWSRLDPRPVCRSGDETIRALASLHMCNHLSNNEYVTQTLHRVTKSIILCVFTSGCET